MRVKLYSELSKLEQQRAQDIFFETSEKKSFSSASEKQKFLEKYFLNYCRLSPSYFFVALKDKKVLGYICGSPETNDEMIKLNPYLALFTDSLHVYPAHLHINCSTETQGMGVGSRLMTHFCSHLQAQACQGVHIITTGSARNRSFYKKVGFRYQKSALWHGVELLFMGKAL